MFWQIKFGKLHVALICQICQTKGKLKQTLNVVYSILLHTYVDMQTYVSDFVNSIYCPFNEKPQLILAKQIV